MNIKLQFKNQSPEESRKASVRSIFCLISRSARYLFRVIDDKAHDSASKERE